MVQEHEAERLRRVIAEYERNSTKTKWLLRQLGLKVRYFPRDLSRRLRRSIQKRRVRSTALAPLYESVSKRTLDAFSGHPFIVPPDRASDLATILCEDRESRTALAEMKAFMTSDRMADLVAEAAAFDPEVGTLDGSEGSYCPPWHDLAYCRVHAMIEAIPPGPYHSVILMPAGRMGGADLVAAILAKALAEQGRTLILRTDDSHWDRPDWYPEDVPSIDISVHLKAHEDARRALYVLLSGLGAKKIFNVNSRLAFETFAEFGARLALQVRLYAYYFCSDRTETGLEVGYPIWYFANILPHLAAAVIDTQDLAETLIDRFAIPPDVAKRIVTVYTPAQTPIAVPPMVERESASLTPGYRPRILWAGRLDRQKRFDLVVDVARAMPDVEFHCWGKAVLDAPPNLALLPKNLILNPPFSSYDELPLAESQGWLYTSSWDGLPTILIELGALGVPIVASAVGGVPELIDETTGWPVRPGASVSEYVAAIRAMLADRSERARRAAALQASVQRKHSAAAYEAAITNL